jgi:hypothetical protein
LYGTISLDLEENAQEATWNEERKTRATRKATQISTHSPVKIKTLFAYLEKLLYLCADFWKKMKCGCKIWAGKSYYI